MNTITLHDRFVWQTSSSYVNILRNENVESQIFNPEDIIKCWPASRVLQSFLRSADRSDEDEDIFLHPGRGLRGSRVASWTSR